MILRNCTYKEIENRFEGRKVVIFGAGDYFRYYVSEHLPVDIRNKVEYFIDNSTEISHIATWDKKYEICEPSKLNNETDCIVLIASSNNMLEMYEQLEKMELPDTIECYSFGLIMANSCGNEDDNIIRILFDKSRDERIPRIIHTFWFSGDEKPEEYRRCIDSWYRLCPDYRIIEWNCNNYDWRKSHFVEEAILNKKWAFASDFARLDVILDYGGIYLDSDMELRCPLDDMLGNKALFTFDSSNDIDLCMFASVPHNEMLEDLIKLYKDLDFSIDKISELCQPRLVRDIFRRKGINLNGDMQIKNENIFLSRNYFSPLDNFIYEILDDEWNPYGIHHYNAGWRNDGFKKSRIEKNRQLMRRVLMQPK